MRRSTIGIDAVLRLFWRMARHPAIGMKLVALQADKQFFRAIHPRAASGRAGRIRQLGLRITDVCNLRCVACGQWGPEGFLHAASLAELKQGEVTPARYRTIFADLAANGHYPFVYFWGGEPMLYEGTVDLIEECTRLGMPASIATNGTRVAAAAERLARAPLFLLQVSIDGPTADIHNRIRPAVGGRDNFADILAALEAVTERRRGGLPLIASLTTLSKENVRHLVTIYQAFRDKVDFFVFYLAWWISEERSSRHEEEFRRRFGKEACLQKGWIGNWLPDDFPALDRQLKELRAMSRRRGMPPVIVLPSIAGEENLRRYYTDHAERFGFDQCISIYQAAEVNSNGDVSPCRDYHDYVVGNIREATLSELWNGEAYRRFRRSLSAEGLMPVCSRCCGLMGY